MKRVALFTDFNPISGGGAAILRSLIGHVREIELLWFHTAPTPVNLPNTLLIESDSIHSSWIPSLSRTFMRLGGRRGSILKMSEPIAAWNADVHWVVAHGLGIAIGNALYSLRPDVPLHVTVHDDPERGVLRRSRRLFWAARLIRPSMRRLMLRAQTHDVVTHQMRAYYENQWGIQAEVVRAYVPYLEILPEFQSAKFNFTVGCIGSIYSPSQFFCFLRGLVSYGRKLGKRPRVVLIGNKPSYLDKIITTLGREDSVMALGHVDEDLATDELRKCDIVYAAYPFGRAAKVFRMTSFPTKLATYARTQRPIFAHTLEDSTLAEVVSVYKIGQVCRASNAEVIANAIQRTAASGCGPAEFERFRAAVFGFENVRRIESLLLKSPHDEIQLDGIAARHAL
jgi:hypothetical protein